jgi:hypothetical protein
MDLPECPYGAGCYRKNPAHFKEFSHPPGTVRPGDVDVPSGLMRASSTVGAPSQAPTLVRASPPPQPGVTVVRSRFFGTSDQRLGPNSSDATGESGGSGRGSGGVAGGGGFGGGGGASGGVLKRAASVALDDEGRGGKVGRTPAGDQVDLVDLCSDSDSVEEPPAPKPKPVIPVAGVPPLAAGAGSGIGGSDARLKPAASAAADPKPKAKPKAQSEAAAKKALAAQAPMEVSAAMKKTPAKGSDPAGPAGGSKASSKAKPKAASDYKGPNLNENLTNVSALHVWGGEGAGRWYGPGICVPALAHTHTHPNPDACVCSVRHVCWARCGAGAACTLGGWLRAS